MDFKAAKTPVMYREIDEKTLDRLRQIVGDGNVLTDPDIVEPYSHDETPGLASMPGVAVKPGSTQEVTKILTLANKERIPITPRGGGTGLSGGAVPYLGGIVLSLEKMDSIKEIDTENLMAIVEPGVVTERLGKEVEKEGLFYPPDPASLDSCTIGGNIAECAGGPKTVKYGVTRDYVCGLEVVLPTGATTRLGGKLVKNVTGYSLLDLIVGSEGTLGVVTEATLRLLPQPAEKVDLLIPYRSMDSAAKTASEIMRKRLIPTALEFMEREAIKACEAFLGRSLPFTDAEAHLLIELDGSGKEELQREYEAIGEIAMDNGAPEVYVAEDYKSQEKMWEARRAITDALKATGEVAHEDLVVPRSEMPKLLQRMKEIGSKHSVKIVCYGHLGDGNLHTNILREGMEEREWRRTLSRIVKELYEELVALGGMLSGEHGIGLTKKPYLSMVLDGPQIECMKSIKRIFDPNNILNPGKIFDL